MDTNAFLEDFTKLEAKHGVRVTGIAELLDDTRRFYFGDFFITSHAHQPPPEKPPLGLLPHGMWQSRRISELMRAIIRYQDAGYAVPPEWHSELKLLMNAA